MKTSLRSLMLILTLLVAAPAHAEVEASLRGWNLLAKDWDQRHPLDFMTIEWQYFMVHDYEGKFNGIVGYVLTNPRGKGGPAGALVVPKGGNVAIGGQIHGQKAVGEYINFGIANTKASGEDLETSFMDPKTGYWASLEAVEADQPALRLQGHTEQFAWDLQVAESAHEVMKLSRETGEAFTVASDSKRAGRIPGEIWTVDAIWPRAQIQGTITVLATGEVLRIEGKGYRENSWGRYAMPLDGWDFLVFSEADEQGVIAVLQTYHHSTDLDFADVSFLDQGQRKIVRFNGANKALQWRHEAWTFDSAARQCVPMDWRVLAENNEYRLVLNADIPDAAQAPFLSNKTLGTSAFFIHEQYPTVSGQIFRKSDNSLVTNFSGQAGGEFSLHKSLANKKSDQTCEQWGRRFSNWFW